MYHYRIEHNYRSFFFIIEDRTWIRLDGTRVWCEKEQTELSKICSKKYNKSLDDFKPILKSYSELKEESDKKEKKKKKTAVKSLFKNWKIKIK